MHTNNPPSKLLWFIATFVGIGFILFVIGLVAGLLRGTLTPDLLGEVELAATTAGAGLAIIFYLIYRLIDRLITVEACLSDCGNRLKTMRDDSTAKQ